MTGVDMQQSKGSLYRSSPLSSNATVVLWGEVDSEKREPVAWTHQYGDSRVFYTSLGHPDDFRDAGFARLLENGIRWSMKMNIGLEPEKKK
jgi:type 1 glutamine amidotransferase